MDERDICYEFFCQMRLLHTLDLMGILPYRLTRLEFGVLKYLRHHCRKEGDALRVAELIHALERSGPGISRTLGAMERRDLIVRRLDADDRRGTRVQLTAHGAEVVDACMRVLQDYSRRVEEAMGEEDLQKLFYYMDKMLRISKAELAKWACEDQTEGEER